MLKISYDNHVANWKHCDRCPLCKTRKKTALARGKLPASVMFIGEAPGDSEDVFGKPFCGVAGQFLDEMIEQAWALAQSKERFIMTNLIACLPSSKVLANKSQLDEDKSWEPTPEEISHCSGRLIELIKIVRPKLIICLGDLAGKYVPKTLEKTRLEPMIFKLPHPARILRLSATNQQGAARMRKQFVIRLANTLLVFKKVST